jgi:two-component system cell cycle response regulator
MYEPKDIKILAVDDEPMMLNIVETALAEQGYLVATASGGQEALEKVRAFSPDVILLDVIMPDITGFDIAERLKSDPATSGISIIMVTGLGSIEDRVKGLESGADDFLSKPFNLDELVVRVRSLAKLKVLQDRIKTMEKKCPDLKARGSRRMPLVLAVEDDERIVHICRNVLGASGYEVAGAANAEEALSFIQSQTPDIIILDLMLPGRDGLELLSEIRKINTVSRVPVIILTALGDLKTKLKGFYIGADDYLVKPLSSMELLARVRANLRKYEYEKALAR